MQPQEHHAMVIAQTFPSGAEEWYCPTCGYRFLMQWPPQFKKILLSEGDPNAIHSGGSGGIQMDSAEVHPNEQTHPEAVDDNGKNAAELIDESRLDAWMQFIDDLDVPGELDDDQTGDPE